MTRTLFACAWAILIVAEGWQGFVRKTPSVSIRGAEPISIDEFGAGTRITQTFHMIGDGLTAVTMQFSSDRETTLFLLCELDLETSPDRLSVVHQWPQTLKRVAGTRSYRFEFPPVPDSNERNYAFRIRLLSTSSTEHPRIGVVASRDNVFRGGALWIGTERQVGSATLRAYRVADTVYKRFRTDVEPKLPSPLRNRLVQLCLLLVYHGAWLIFSYAFLVGELRTVRQPSRVTSV